MMPAVTLCLSFPFRGELRVKWGGLRNGSGARKEQEEAVKGTVKEGRLGWVHPPGEEEQGNGFKWVSLCQSLRLCVRGAAGQIGTEPPDQT